MAWWLIRAIWWVSGNADLEAMASVLRPFLANTDGMQAHDVVVANNARLCLSEASSVWLDRHGSTIEYSIDNVRAVEMCGCHSGDRMCHMWRCGGGCSAQARWRIRAGCTGWDLGAHRSARAVGASARHDRCPARQHCSR